MQEKQRKNKEGVVIRKSGLKTIIVEVEAFAMDATYGKYMRKRKKFHVHDEDNKCQVGDKVKIVETRPISKTKCWKVASILGHGLFVEKGMADTAKLAEEATLKDTLI